MNRRLILSAFLVLCLSTGLLAQGKLGVYAAAFYNLENLWDTEDNPDNPGDDDFTPGGKYEWTQVKYEQKLQNVAKVISQLARDYCPAGPAIIGISEVENKKVLEDLVKTEPIASLGLPDSAFRESRPPWHRCGCPLQSATVYFCVCTYLSVCQARHAGL